MQLPSRVKFTNSPGGGGSVNEPPNFQSGALRYVNISWYHSNFFDNHRSVINEFVNILSKFFFYQSEILFYYFTCVILEYLDTVLPFFLTI